MDKLTLITSPICPFARRACIVLREKDPKKSFKEIEVHLEQKSEFFKTEYAKSIGRVPENEGKVPILNDDGVYLAESELIAWYLSQKFADIGTQLIPQDHVERFRMRLFIQNFSNKMPSVLFGFIGWNRKNEEQKQALIKKKDEYLENLNNEIKLPYALGDQFNLADVLIYPFFECWGGIEHYTQVPIDKKYEKIHQYVANLQKLESIKDGIRPVEDYVKGCAKFFK